MTVRRNKTTPAAGAFDVEDEFQFKCIVRKGDVGENPRGGKNVEFKAKVSEGLVVAKAKVLSLVQRTLPSVQLISEDLYFKKSKGAPQSQYVVLTNDNFQQMAKARWDLISQRDVSSWADDGKNVLEAFFFEVFIYMHRRTVASIPTGLRREREEGVDEERISKKIRIELNGCWLDVRVDVNSLRRALGLPLHDIFDGGIYNEYMHHETVGPDVEDTDHGATQPLVLTAADIDTNNDGNNTSTAV